MEKKFGLLGEKLGHSYSPQIHSRLKDYEYKLYEVARENVTEFLAATELSGMNVTIPYKKTVLDQLSWISEVGKKMGCVNTLVKKEDGWHGYNTDYYGFCALVKHSGIEVSGKKALVLGSGGASNTVCRALEDLGAAEILVISRSGENNYDNIAKHADAKIVVNTTPVGMYPNNGVSPLDLRVFTALDGVLDVVYNPSRTAIILQAEELGIPCASGLYMLVAQAKRAAELFTDTVIEDRVIGEITAELERQMLNIILVGMPGCGKSAIGRRLSEKTGMPLIEADREIIAMAGKEIPAIFAESGEPGFRAIETRVLAEAGKRSGCILSTGGGCITRPENYPLLHQNGQIIWIRRALKDLPTDGRPLSQANPLEKLYAERKDKYAAFADYTVDNSGTIDEAADTILKLLGM